MISARRSSIAGTWYPGDPVELAALVERCVADAPAARPPGGLEPGGLEEAELVALVCPHAGLHYSGRIAAAGYRLLDGVELDSVLLLGPCHRGGDALAVLPDGAIETPLGTVRIDSELAAALCAFSPEIRASAAPHALEHSLEVQLPFLQRFLPGVPVIPVLMGAQTRNVIALAAEAIEHVVAASDRRVLLVASSDLSHYESRAVAAELDGAVVDCLERFDVSSLEQLMQSTPRHACGGGPMVSVLRAARASGATGSRVLAYGDSGDANGDLDGVVGYVAAAFFRGAPA
jgi:hypothetical protein